MNKTKFSLKGIIFIIMIISLLNSFAFGQTITINWNTVRQEIDGFGASGAFKQADDLKKFPDATRREILDLLFSQTTGIGLSMVRNMVGDGSMSEWGTSVDGPIETIEPQNGVWNFNAVDEQIWFMKEAEARGCTRFFSTVWSPPRWMKDNNSCINGGSVLSSMYDEYAEYLYQYVHEYMANRNNITIYAISMANEPNLNTGYSSCRWTGEQFRTLIRNNVGPRFADSDTKIIIGEDSGWTEEPANATLNDSAAAQYLDIVAAHNYGSNNYNPFTNTKSKNKRVWQTEVSNLGDNDSSMNDGMKWAKEIHTFLTRAEGNSWCYWWAICYKVNPAKGEGLININTSNNTYFTNRRLYTMGNYSKFIRPGWFRITTSTDSSNGVLITAFKNTSTNDFAIVAINESSSTQTRSFTINGYSVSSVIPHVTTSNINLAQSSAITVTNNTFSATMPANSVTTFVNGGGGIDPTPTPAVDGNIIIRARGTMGGENLELRVDGNVVDSWTMSTSYQDFYADGTGEIEVHFTNDDQVENGMDIQVDYIIYNNTTYQAEDQETNTGVYMDGSCGGSYSDMLQCNGYILFNTGGVITGDLGDVDSNGEINIIDALLVAQYYVDLDPENFDPDKADTDCNGNINIVDALLIAQHYVGLITEFCQV